MSSFSVTKYIGPAAIVIFVLVVIAAAFAVVMPFLAAIVWGAIVAIATWKPFCWVRDRIFRGHASAAAVSIVFLLIIVILVPFSVGVYGAYQKVADFSYSVMHSADVSQNSEEKPVPDMSLSQVLNSGVPRAFKIKALADGVAAQDKSGSEAASAGGTGILSESDGAFSDGFAGVAGTVTEGSPEDASAAGSETSESAREPAETQGTAEQAGAGERAAKGSDAAHPAEPAPQEVHHPAHPTTVRSSENIARKRMTAAAPTRPSSIPKASPTAPSTRATRPPAAGASSAAVSR